MTTEEIIIQIFCQVDDQLKGIKKVPQAKLYPSEVVTIGILFALKGGHFRAFYRWLKRDFDALFGSLPDRTTLGRNLTRHQALCDELLETPSILNVVDSYPIELLFPIRAGRTKHQIGKKGRDKGRWSIGMKLCWVLNTYGQVVGWSNNTMNRFDTTFHDLIRSFDQEAVILADLGFRAKKDTPTNLKVCCKGTWNERMAVETTFSLLTVVCNAKKMFHRRLPQLEARFAYTAAMFNTLLTLSRAFDPQPDPFKVSIAQFSL
jgi:hypothetical protein